ncbi:MAG: hypothetical protein PWP24_856 [Clostridiales bacterium]|nr:hypothetical protein [Clostridiales bacterium]
MKWKRKVKMTTEQGNVILWLGRNRCQVAQEDRYLAEAIKEGLHEEEKLKALIMEHDNANEIVAGFTLAKFILDYQDYIEKDHGYYEITM